MEQAAVDAIIGETARLGDAIAERLSAAERFVAVAGALAGVGLTLGLYQDQKEVLIGLPLAVGIIFLFMMQIYTDAAMHSGHRQALEAELERLFGRPVLVGQGRVAANHSRRTSIPMTFCLVIAIWAGAVVLGAFAIADLHSGTVRCVLGGTYLFLIVLLIATMCVAIKENQGAEAKTRAIAEKAMSPEVAAEVVGTE